jgi:C4-dicarboxylate transporter DctQ subunit
MCISSLSPPPCHRAAPLVSRPWRGLRRSSALILAWYGLTWSLTNIERNDFDVRAYFYPRWLLTIAFPIAFGLMAIEFARFVFGRALHSGEAGIHE